MLGMTVAPGQYVRPRMLFLYLDCGPRAYPPRSSGVSPSGYSRAGLWIPTRCGISVPQANDGSPSAPVHRCDWVRRFLGIDVPLGIDRTCPFRSLVASPRWLDGRRRTLNRDRDGSISTRSP